jgi:chemotaxis protein CheC
MEISDVTRDILTELINSGMGRAAKSLNEHLDHEIDLSVPIVHVLDYHEMSAYIERVGKAPYVNVVQSFHGELSGKGIVSFPILKGKTLVNMLLESSDDISSDFSVDEEEAICEVGNMIINAVQGVISDMIQQEVECRLPAMFVSRELIPGNILDRENIYIVGETVLAVRGVNVEGRILLIYAYEKLDLLTRLFVDLYEEA